MYSHAATILSVQDIPRALDFYTSKLGFECSFLWEDPPSYAVLNYQDKIHIHLSLALPKGDTFPNRPALSFFVFDVNAVYAQLQSKGVEIHHPIGTREYGMRDFDILDPDGHLITFGTHIDHLTQ